LESLRDLFYTIDTKLIDVTDRTFDFPSSISSLEEQNQYSEIQKLQNYAKLLEKIDLENRDLKGKLELEKGLKDRLLQVKDEYAEKSSSNAKFLKEALEKGSKTREDLASLKVEFYAKLEEVRKLRLIVNDLETIKVKFDVLTEVQECHY
jgi:DNA repair exonuclease SbcCD ATPase subunit